MCMCMRMGTEHSLQLRRFVPNQRTRKHTQHTHTHSHSTHMHTHTHTHREQQTTGIQQQSTHTATREQGQQRTHAKLILNADWITR